MQFLFHDKLCTAFIANACFDRKHYGNNSFFVNGMSSVLDKAMCYKIHHIKETKFTE